MNNKLVKFVLSLHPEPDIARGERFYMQSIKIFPGEENNCRKIYYPQQDVLCCCGRRSHSDEAA